MNNTMVDLETLGNGSNSVIVAIGAVEFDETGIGKEFYCTVEPESCVQMGMKMDASTVMWWMKQSDAARAALTQPGHNIQTALAMFGLWLTPSSTIWGNGATFDNVILANAYSVVGLTRPWKYTADRCYRTMKAMFPNIKPPADIGTAHNALDDAKYQALHMVEILKGVNHANTSQQA